VNAENNNLAPSFVVLQVGLRRIALPREGVAELIASPLLYACELVAGIMLPAADQDGFVTGLLDLNGEQIAVLDLEKAIAINAASKEKWTPATEALF
jgi:chemotaxis signal transduction protein